MSTVSTLKLPSPSSPDAVSGLSLSPVQTTSGSLYFPNPPTSPRKLAIATRNNPTCFSNEAAAIEHERLVKSLLKQFKRLELTLSKFESKLNGILKTNMLRTILLPFLRLQLPLDELFLKNSNIYSSFVSVSVTILGRWWRLLLHALSASTPSHQVSLTDRNAYLECISRILCRREWFLAGPETMCSYTNRLADTLDYAIGKLSTMKVVPVLISAFVGKVFAYAFFFLPGVSNALLFLLNIKQLTLESSLAKVERFLLDVVKTARTVFPNHLAPFVNYRGLERMDRNRKKSINCVPPPKHPVRGITDPNGPWVLSWMSCDSDIFNSFFRHYVNISRFFVDDHREVPFEAFPGIHVILCNVHQIFNVCVSKILLETANNGSFKRLSISKLSLQQSLQQSSSALLALSLQQSAPLLYEPIVRPMDANYAPLIKLFKTIRDIGFSNVSFLDSIVRSVDKIMINLASTTSIYDFGRSASIFNLVCEYSNYVADPTDIDWEFWLGCAHLTLSKTSLIQSIIMSFAFLFNVWNVIPSQLSQSPCPAKEAHLSEWLTNTSESYKENFARWLTCNDIWLVYFTHWNPLVRAYYMRLISWRVIGFNNYDSSVSILTTHRIKSKVDVIYECLMRVTSSTELPLRLQRLDFSPDLPMVNRKLGIVPVNSRRASDDVLSLASVTCSAKLSDLRKSNPYEILDEAVYTCSLLSNTTMGDGGKERGGKLTRNHSLISSFGKFFKLLSTDDDSDDKLLTVAPPTIGNTGANGLIGIDNNRLDQSGNSIACGRRSKSFNSFLTGALSSRSGSSSPSLKSIQRSCDTPTDLPATSDSESSSTLSSYLGSSSASTLSSSQNSLSKNPPELIKHTPDIVRPLYKFEVTLDHHVISRKVDQMQTANSQQTLSFYDTSSTTLNSSLSVAQRTRPGLPRIPSTSLFISSDRYCRFYVLKEEFDFEDVIPTDDEKAPTIDDMLRQIKTPTALAALGRALNEWNMIVDEFESFLALTVEADQANSLPKDSIGEPVQEIDEEEYYKKIVPFMPIDNFIELKLLNAM